MNYDFTMWLEVFDPEQLYQAAVVHPDAEGLALKDENGKVDIETCLVVLLDPGSLPGCSIQESSAHRPSDM